MRYKIQSIFLIIGIALSSIGGQAQSCDSIVLNNQTDINNFIKNYGNCTTIRDLTITNRDSDITQLDSLYTIDRITGTILFTNQIQGREINIGAIKGLKYLNNLISTIVKTLHKCTGEIDISDLPYGLYVFDIAYYGKTEKHKIVKIN